MHTAIRSAIAFNMKGIVAQKLLKSIKPGVGRVPTCEIMLFTTNIQKPFWKRTTASCPTPSASASRRHARFHDEPQATDRRRADRPEVAMEVAPNREALKMALKGIEVKDPGII